MTTIIKCIATMCLCFLAWEGSQASEWMANQPSDLSIFASGIIIFLTMVLFFYFLYQIWRKQFNKIKENFEAWCQDSQD